MSWSASIFPMKPLGGLARIQAGYAFESARFTDSPNDVPLVKGENVQQGYVDWSIAKRWPETEMDALEQFLLRPGDIVVAMDRPWVEAGLKWAYIKPEDPPSLLVQRVARLRAGPELDQTYLRAVISSSYFSGYIQPIVTGVNVPHISGKQIAGFKVPVPPMEQQRKVAALISAYDDLISNNQRRIALLESMTEEIYREWFVRMRFPGADRGRSSNGVPAGWEARSLRSLITHYIGGGWGEEQPSTTCPDGAFVFRGTDLPAIQDGDWGEFVYRFHKTSALASRTLVAGDFVFEVSGGSTNQLLGRNLMVSAQLLEHLDAPAICASFCKLIRFDHSAIAPLWMKYFLKLYYESGLVGLYQVQSTGISNYQFEAFITRQTVLVPDTRLQAEFCKLVEPLNEQRDSLARANLRLKKMRDALLPRLISGKLRVDGLDIQFPPSMQPPPAEAAQRVTRSR